MRMLGGEVKVCCGALLLKIFDYKLLAVIHPTSKANEQKA